MSPEQPSRARRLLVIDASGALVTAAITLGLLASGVFPSGVPSTAWWVLGSIAAGLAACGGVALWRPWSPAPPLRALALANLSYALASLLLLGLFCDTATTVVVAYILIEGMLLTVLACIEWRESQRAT